MISELIERHGLHLYINSLAIMINQVLAAFFGLIFWILAARIMTASDIGFATAIISVATMILYISRFGLDAGLMRFLPASNDRSRMYNSTLIVTLLLALGISLVYLLGIDLFSYSLRFLNEPVLALIFLSYVAFLSINMSQNSAITALRRADLLLLQNSVLGVRILLLFFVTALGLSGILLSFTFSYFIAFVVGSIILFGNKIYIAPRVQISSIKELFTFSFSNYLASIFIAAPLTILPIAIIGTLGPDQNAYFYIAYSIAAFLFAIPNSVSMSLFVEGSYDQPLKANTIKSIKFILLLLLPSITVIMLFGSNILSLFNKEYAIYSVDILKLLAIASLFNIAPAVYLAIKKIQKDLKAITYLTFIQSAIIIILGYLMLPQYGISGIGYAWIIASMIINVVISLLILKDEKWIKYVIYGAIVKFRSKYTAH